MSSESEDFGAVAASVGTIEKLDVPAMRLMFRLENAGEAFYQQLAERLASPEAAALLRKNAREERGHAERLRRAIACKLGRPWEPEPADLAPFALALPAAIDATLLAGIAEGERQGDAGYQRWADAESDPEVQRLLRQNGREETLHAERVQQAIALLARG
jgi:rubrerythrin